MPTIAIIDGIAILMHYRTREHPPPHIHARYDNYNAKFSISDGELIKGNFPPGPCTRTVKEWVREHRDKLLLLWETNDFENIKFD